MMRLARMSGYEIIQLGECTMDYAGRLRTLEASRHVLRAGCQP